MDHKDRALSLSALERSPGGAEALERAGPAARRRLESLFALGGAVAEWVLFDPALIDGLALPAEELSPAALQAALETLEPEGFWDALRRFRRRVLLRIAAEEVGDPAPLSSAASETAGAHLSNLARALIQRGLTELGGGERLSVIALGKLGGWELNYSSDVDLIFLRPERDAAVERIARLLTGELERSTARGFLYRVDLRLRPYGRAGALSPRAGAAADYYLKRGRPWERRAFVRSQFLCGCRGAAETFFEEVDPFLWRRPVREEGIRSFIDHRARSIASVAEPERHIKKGPGGIRDIEFATQFLQLFHGRSRPELRPPGTRPAVRALHAGGVLTADEARTFLEAYELQRAIEHRLQLRLDREHEVLPKAAEERAVVAASLGLELGELDRRLEDARREVNLLVERVISIPFARAAGAVGAELSLRDILLHDQADAAAGAAHLKARGFARPARAFENLRSLGEESNPYLAPSGRARTFLAGLAPRLIDLILKTADPDRSLRNLALAVSTLGAKATFLQLLLEDDDTLPIFIRLAEASDFLVQTLARRPAVMDEVVDRLMTVRAVAPEQLRREAAAALTQPDPIAALRTIKAIITMLVGIHDLAGRYNVQNVGRDLSALADGVLEVLWRLAARRAEDRCGERPLDKEGRPLPFAVLAAGKLGGRELSYGSDYDLIFVHGGGGAAAGRYFHVLVQELIRLAGLRGDGEALAPVDARLRPAGSQSLLSRSLSSTLRYYAGTNTGDRAATWEHLALVKLRPVCGDGDFPERAVAAIQEARFARVYGPDIWDEVLGMRRQQIAACEPRHLKRGPGGLADIAFLTSGLSLRHGGGRPRLRQANTALLIRALREEGLLGEAEEADLLTAYQFLRSAEARLRLLDGRPSAIIPEEASALRDLARRLGYVDAAQRAEALFEEEWSFQRQTVQRRLERIVARDRGAQASA